MSDDIFLAMMENNALHHVPRGTVFQLDGSSSHFTYCVCAFLVREFPGCWIGGGGGEDLSPGTLILQTLLMWIFFFWEFVHYLL
jgi:hypothetical protein